MPGGKIQSKQNENDKLDAEPAKGDMEWHSSFGETGSLYHHRSSLGSTPYHLPNYTLPLTHPRGSFTPSLLLNLDSSTSGYTSLDKASAHGAAITEAEIKDEASICKARWGISTTAGLNLGALGVMMWTVPHPKGYEGSQHSACNGSKASSHHSMYFREGHVCKVGTDEQRCLCLKTKKKQSYSKSSTAHPEVLIWGVAWMHALPASGQKALPLGFRPAKPSPCWPCFHLFLYHVIKGCRQPVFIYSVYHV